ncbi:MAG: ATP-binding protein, partial [Trebonia sp.]
MAWAEPATGPWASLTSFVGRDREADDLTKLLQDYRLVTVTGPGGVGKTRLAVEVARSLANQFPDGVCFIGLGTVTDATRVPAEVAAALDIRQAGSRPVREVLAEVLAPQRMLLVLDNCEHVLDEVAPLCGDLLKAADDLRILATSREQLWVGGEARYRLSPLTLPASDEADAIGRSEAVALFTERARHASPDFTLTPQHASLAARVAARLDGMPLAIELAAARVEALGMAGLANRIDDALRLLGTRDPLAAARHKSLGAVADWSYQLLLPDEQRVFRRLAAFPAPFTLEAAEAVAGPGAGAVVLRLVDCSLVAPPRPGPDRRMRYPMLHTLRSYGQAELTGAGEIAETSDSLAAFALSVAQQATTGLETSDRELACLHWLDAEEATLSQALRWTLDHDPDIALRLAIALAPWWWLRGRYAEGYAQLSAAATHVSSDEPRWAKAQLWLGNLCVYFSDYTTGVGHYTAVCEADSGSPASPEAVEALSSQAITLVNLGRTAEASSDGRQALTLARELGSPAAEIQALTALSVTSYYAGNVQEALDWAQQTQEFTTAGVPGWVTRMCRVVLALVLTDAGELDRARHASADALARSREVGDLVDLASLLLVRARIERLAGNRDEARSYLHETVHVASRTGDWPNLHNSLEECGYLCAETGRWADAVTLWSAHEADSKRTGIPGHSSYDARPEFIPDMEKALRPAQIRAAEDRGTGMSLSTAVEF